MIKNDNIDAEISINMNPLNPKAHEEHRKNEKILGRNIDAFFKLLEKENKLECMGTVI